MYLEAQRLNDRHLKGYDKLATKCQFIFHWLVRRFDVSCVWIGCYQLFTVCSLHGAKTIRSYYLKPQNRALIERFSYNTKYFR